MTVSQSRPPNDSTVSLAVQLAEALARVSRRLRRDAMRELAPLSVTYTQVRVLHVLARNGRPVRIGELAMRFEVAPRSATSMIDSLEAADLVRRTADPTDRRSVLVGLTPQGVTLMERGRSLKRTSAEALFGRLSLDERQELLALLTTLCETDSGCSRSEVVPAAAVVASRQVRGAGTEHPA